MIFESKHILVGAITASDGVVKDAVTSFDTTSWTVSAVNELPAQTGAKQVSSVDLSNAVAANADDISIMVIDTSVKSIPEDRWLLSGIDGAQIETNLAKSAASDFITISDTSNTLTITAKDYNTTFDLVAYYEKDGTQTKITPSVDTPTTFTVGQPSDIEQLIKDALGHEGITDFIARYRPYPNYTIEASSVIVLTLEKDEAAKDGSGVMRKNRAILYVCDPNASVATTGAKDVLESAAAFDDNSLFQ